MKNKYRFMKGPLKSRRLGVSLGIDLMPYNICSENCVYCECGPTKLLTARRDEYVSAEEVKEEISKKLKEELKCDYITFSGRGEPTLHSEIGEIIDFIKENHSKYRVSVLTNSTLLHRKDVRDGLKNADLVVPSLDAGTEKAFRKVCRPAEAVSFEDTVMGIKKFSREYTGEIFLEIMLLPGFNDSSPELNEIIKIVEEVEPDRVDLNTLDRAPALTGVNGMSRSKMKRIAEDFPGKVKIFS